jgi:hypothetical protein
MTRLISPVDPAAPQAVRLPSGAGTIDMSGAVSALASTSANDDRMALRNVASLKVSQFSLEVVGQIGFKDIISVGGDANTDYYLLDFLATTDDIPAPDHPNVAMVMGVGVRVALKSNSVSGKARGNFAGVASSAELSQGTASIGVQLIGIPDDALQDKVVKPLTGLGGKFDIAAMRVFGSALSAFGKALVESYAKDPLPFIKAMRMVSVVEHGPEAYPGSTLAGSIGYALHLITHQKTVDFALDFLQERDTYIQSLSNQDRAEEPPYGDVDPIVVQIVYGNLVRSAGATPSGDENKFADSIQRIH